MAGNKRCVLNIFSFLSFSVKKHTTKSLRFVSFLYSKYIIIVLNKFAEFEIFKNVLNGTGECVKVSGEHLSIGCRIFTRRQGNADALNKHKIY